jgi:hypothetical protein
MSRGATVVMIIETAAAADPADVQALMEAGVSIVRCEDASCIHLRQIGHGPDRVALYALEAIAKLGDNDAARRVRSAIAERLVADARSEMAQRVQP